MTTLPMSLVHENGKKITVDVFTPSTVSLIVWRKNDAPMLPLHLTLSEAQGLATLLTKRIADAKRSGQ